jgi:hypothetical protein
MSSADVGTHRTLVNDYHPNLPPNVSAMTVVSVLQHEDDCPRHFSSTHNVHPLRVTVKKGSEETVEIFKNATQMGLKMKRFGSVNKLTRAINTGERIYTLEGTGPDEETTWRHFSTRWPRNSETHANSYRRWRVHDQTCPLRDD